MGRSIRLCVAVVCFLFVLLLSGAQGNRPPLFIVPRVDGVVSCFEALSGKPLWNFSTGGPLVSSTSDNPDSEPFVSTNELNIFNTIQRDGLKELYPETNTVLGATPFMSDDGTIFLSHKNSKMFGLDPLTGNVLPSHSARKREETLLVTGENDEDTDPACFSMLQIVRTEHTLETHNGSSTRFLTVAHIRAFLQSCPGDEAYGSDIKAVLLPTLTSTRLGDLQALDHSGKPLWISHMPAPHSQLVYALTAQKLSPIRPTTPTEPLQKMTLSLTNYKGTPYETSFGSNSKLALPPPDQPATPNTGIKLIWIATICICTTATIWGIIILRHPQYRRSSIRAIFPSSYPPTPTYAPSANLFTPTSSASMVPRSASTTQLHEEHKQLKQQLHDLLRLQEVQEQKHLQQTMQLQELQLLQEQQVQQQLQQQFLQQLQQLQPHPVDMPITKSRYRGDFEEKERLGEGGFGTVFLAINKLDGVEYAIKKVCLTTVSKENARVLREIRYLALLDHPNIVRYFQSWVEEDEWDEWDECRIGSRMEDYEGDEEDYADEEEEGESSMDRSVSVSVSRSLPFDDDDYEGDESRGVTADSSDSSVSVVDADFIVTSARLESFNFAKNAENKVRSQGFDKRSKLKRDKRLSLDDGTQSRTYGSTSNPISADSRQREQNRSRKPILYIQMQYCHQGTLHHWLSRTDRVICAEEAMSIFRQAVRGVVHIHSHHVIHRDLKPPNILISADGCIKIGDFGLSTGGVQDSFPQSPTRSLSFSHTTGVGSPLYCSPEQLKGERYDDKVDIFSLGVILFEMFHIFTTQMERVSSLTQFRDGIISEQTQQMYPELVDLALNLVHVNPNLRPPAKDILDHPLLGSRFS